MRYQSIPEGLGLTSWLGATPDQPHIFCPAWAALVDCVSELEGLEEGPANIDSILHSMHVRVTVPSIQTCIIMLAKKIRNLVHLS